MKAPLRALEDVAVLVGGGTPSRSMTEYFSGKVPWVTPSDLPPPGTVRLLGPVAEHITEAGLRNSSATLVPPGTVLFSSRASIGKIAVADRECSTNQGFCNFVPKREVIDAWYLAYCLCSVTDRIVELAGKTTFKEISRKKLRAFSIPVPSIEEQRRIVHRISQCMARIDEMRFLGDHVIAETNALLPALLSAAFAELKTDYSCRTIGTCLVESRYGTSRRCDGSPAATPVLRIPNVAQGMISYSDLKYCDFADRELERLRLKTGDILVVRTNGSRDLVGRCAVYTEDDRSFAFASYLIRLRVDPSVVEPQYLAFFLASTMGRDAIARIRRTSAGQYNVNSENLRGIGLPLPPLPIQRKVTGRLVEQRDIAKEIARNQMANTDHSDLLANAVLRRAFVGEL